MSDSPDVVISPSKAAAAAADAFASAGYGTTTRDIAARLDMSPAAMYPHYRSKEELLFAISYEGHTEALRVVEGADRPGEEPSVRLQELISTFASWQAGTIHSLALSSTNSLPSHQSTTEPSSRFAAARRGWSGRLSMPACSRAISRSPMPSLVPVRRRVPLVPGRQLHESGRHWKTVRRPGIEDGGRRLNQVTPTAERTRPVANRTYLYSTPVAPHENPAAARTRGLKGISVVVRDTAGPEDPCVRESARPPVDHLGRHPRPDRGHRALWSWYRPARRLPRPHRSPRTRHDGGDALRFLRSHTEPDHYFVLECGEIFDMDDEPFAEQGAALMAGLANIDVEMEAALATLAPTKPKFWERLFTPRRRRRGTRTRPRLLGRDPVLRFRPPAIAEPAQPSVSDQLVRKQVPSDFVPDNSTDLPTTASTVLGGWGHSPIDLARRFDP
ncbi:hypothetical protein GCM10020255_017940 [Rhodococcus baikonurensis]